MTPAAEAEEFQLPDVPADLVAMPVPGWTGRQALVEGSRVWVAPQATREAERALAVEAWRVCAVLSWARRG